MNIYTLADKLRTTPSHVAYAHREGLPIHGHQIVREDDDQWLAAPVDEDDAPATLSGIFPGLPFEHYLAIQAANASSLKLARKSIAHMLVPRTEKKAFDLGTSIHSVVLEGAEAFKSRTAVWPETFQTKTGKESTSRNCTEAKEWKERMEADGLILLDRSEMALVARLAKTITENDAARALLERATPAHERRELTCVWHDDEFDVPCKARFDGLPVDGDLVLALDLKTGRSAHHDDFARDAIKYGYDLQAGHYNCGYRAIHGRDLDGYCIIAVETQEPYGCAVYELGPEWLDIGEEKRAEGMERWADWYHAGMPLNEPAYPPYFRRLELPRWA